ncbi:NAD-dependent nucleoside-diphosphate sugar epimerase [Amycolatopsis mediterranei S699]|uniref:NAD-dependent nucleoside-diphosphate sugar epimerase n=2 Tax=Amycolatopsis mediterranei TaxID=33910 RepID=A0A0H3D9K3_AMYMU|nr:TIGR01777 family oxidoreductase [Amycolatopsis mediterranei]ADJ46229.1 NAD-dependent nucleoside-diphosphate sugar epimerase [Amycolatopsis mediterranei U32]AEK43020.1 NAD-dependent nucleoside-diphosphate sugar epimerase [Amycolatopsis mediterranei S699]AFO77940.1 NAD-dependent nucleoside-diphosphate sugar epimerase [Amycolatopsis mediterranei S699]AGT85068.1 NAD-dependent nucleoside-diphosphate sugar epimerase [Amycolatopsis mediterranei RB]KDO05269.1 NAD-dependent epimerase [Amycolatopsis 
MKIVIPGGTGHLGRVLGRALIGQGHEVVVLTRGEVRPEPGVRHVHWDGRGPGPWTAEIDGSDVVLNLAGRSVNCRYTPANLREMLNSRVDSARVVGGAIARAARPPKVWLQMSTATIYAHRFDAPNDETTGILGGDEPDVPAYWSSSVDIAKAWEREQRLAATPDTRKVALRAAMVMSPEPGGALAMLLRLTRLGLGGPVAGGGQYMSWIHEEDLIRAIGFLIERDELSGPVNLAAPEPLPYADFLRVLRRAAGVRVGLPTTRWMAEIGAFVLRSDTELLLKSRRVIPGRLREAGFQFGYPEWPAAAEDLVRRSRSGEPVKAVG